MRAWLAHPLTRGMDLDDPATTALRARIIREKPLLMEIYEEWYEALARCLPRAGGPILEIGSGAGFLRDLIPNLIPSDVFSTPNVRLVLDARRLPFGRGTLSGIAMTDVFHHVSEPRAFLREAARVVADGGAVGMIEPWVTSWSRLVYGRFHHEPFEPESASWEFPTTGPLSGSNIALPWIVFERDRARFEAEFPEWDVERIEPCMPLRYLVSGGVSLRSLVPSVTRPVWRWLDRRLDRSGRAWGLFALIVLRRRRTDAGRGDLAGSAGQGSV